MYILFFLFIGQIEFEEIKDSTVAHSFSSQSYGHGGLNNNNMHQHSRNIGHASNPSYEFYGQPSTMPQQQNLSQRTNYNPSQQQHYLTHPYTQQSHR